MKDGFIGLCYGMSKMQKMFGIGMAIKNPVITDFLMENFPTVQGLQMQNALERIGLMKYDPKKAADEIIEFAKQVTNELPYLRLDMTGILPCSELGHIPVPQATDSA